MTFTVETGNAVPDANSYASVEAFKAYHKDRGTTIAAGKGDIQSALIRGTDYMEARWTWVGVQRTTEQGLHWPAVDAYYPDGRVATGVPPEVLESCCDYAKLELDSPGSLTPNPTYDVSGALVTHKRDKVGPLEEERTYGSGGQVKTFKKFPRADQRLVRAGLVVNGRELLRA